MCKKCKTIGYINNDVIDYIHLDEKIYRSCGHCPSSPINNDKYNTLLYFDFKLIEIVKILFW